MDFGNKLYELRKSKNLSQEELADKLNVTRQTISKWETNQSTPDFDKIIPICNLYGISADELLKGEIEEKKLIYENNDNSNTKKKLIGIIIGIFIYAISIAFIMTSIPVFNVNPIIASSIFIILLTLGTIIIVYSCIIYKKVVQKKELTSEEVKVKNINDIFALIYLIIYLFLSFSTSCWHITWILWIIYAIICKITKLIICKGDNDNGQK